MLNALNLFSMVGKLSSAARMPLPETRSVATVDLIAGAVISLTSPPRPASPPSCPRFCQRKWPGSQGCQERHRLLRTAYRLGHYSRSPKATSYGATGSCFFFRVQVLRRLLLANTAF